MNPVIKHLALIGGGPSALFMYKNIIESDEPFRITIFERSGRLGAGMPYSAHGACREHITNVSSNEIPDLPVAAHQWIGVARKKSPDRIGGALHNYSPYKVFPRLAFGDYLENQFEELINRGRKKGIVTTVYFNTCVSDIHYEAGRVFVTNGKGTTYRFDKAVICTGHTFCQGADAPDSGFYASPYPPQKLSRKCNHPVAVRGASLTAVDAIKTLALANGSFSEGPGGALRYTPGAESKNFKIMMHCRNGMLPAVRFHLQDTHLKNPTALTASQIESHRNSNAGFLSLDYIFEHDFMVPLRQADPVFYDTVKDMAMEEFVAAMLKMRKGKDPFALLKEEFDEAENSIKRQQSIYWKEMLGVLSFAMNYPAKYFSAEDMVRYKKTLHPLISLVIAYLPQSSCRELMALHEAGCLELVRVGRQSRVERNADVGITYHYTDTDGQPVSTYYTTYVDCKGQPHIDYKDFAFRGLLEGRIVSQATLAFQDSSAARAYRAENDDDVILTSNGRYYLKVSGVAINDYFQLIEQSGRANSDIFLMAVPYMGGYNPDYSGLDFAAEASRRIIECLCSGDKVVKNAAIQQPLRAFKRFESA